MTPLVETERLEARRLPRTSRPLAKPGPGRRTVRVPRAGEQQAGLRMIHDDTVIGEQGAQPVHHWDYAVLTRIRLRREELPGLFVPLAHHAKRPALEVDCLPRDRQQLAHPQARVHREPERRLIPWGSAAISAAASAGLAIRSRACSPLGSRRPVQGLTRARPRGIAQA